MYNGVGSRTGRKTFTVPSGPKGPRETVVNIEPTSSVPTVVVPTPAPSGPVTGPVTGPTVIPVDDPSVRRGGPRIPSNRYGGNVASTRDATGVRSTWTQPWRDNRLVAFNSENCICFGYNICNINSYAAISFSIALLLLLLIGIWMSIQPLVFTTLLPIATFLLGVLFPSPIFTPLTNKTPHTIDEQQRIVDMRNQIDTQPTDTTTPIPMVPVPATGGNQVINRGGPTTVGNVVS